MEKIKMSNPWEAIDLSIYEKHMSSAEVYQLQLLNEITKEQLMDNEQAYVSVLGVAGGNGLDNIDISKTKKVYAVDINKNYLDICRERYEFMGEALELLCMDLTDEDAFLPFTNLLICNLIVEYIGEEKFVATIERNKNNVEVVSCVIQKNNNNSFVSNSEHNSHFDPILSIHHDVDEDKLKNLFATIKFNCIKSKEYLLPNGKKFIRMDFSKAL